MLLVIKGSVILRDTLLRIRKSSPGLTIALWQQDSMHRYPIVLNGAELYDHIFVTEPMDLECVASIGVRGSILPSCYDPTIYRPIHNHGLRVFRRDIAFVGEGRPERFKFFRSLAEGLSDMKCEAAIGIYGARWNSFRETALKSRIPGIIWDIVPENISPRVANQVYNESKICINIHHEQARTGVNLRTFEIPGSQSLEIVDRKETLERFFDEGRDLIAFGPGDNLNRILASVLGDLQRIEKMSISAYKRATAEHTYACRISEMLRRL